MLEMVNTSNAPMALGNYSHAVVWKDLIFVAGIASRDPVSNSVPGLVLDGSGKKISYDIVEETKATLRNIKHILEGAGSDLEHVLDVTVFLTDMKDFQAYNKVYGEFFGQHRPARTTVGVSSLPGNISIEMKVIAVRANENRAS